MNAAEVRRDSTLPFAVVREHKMQSGKASAFTYPTSCICRPALGREPINRFSLRRTTEGRFVTL